MANTQTNTVHTLIADAALEAYIAAITPIMAFARNISEAEANRGQKVKVLWLAAAAAAKAWVAANGYELDNETYTGLDVTLDKRQYVTWFLTTEEVANSPQVNLERYGRQKGFALAKAVVQDIWSVVTLANFGAAGFTGAAGTFDADEVANLEQVCDEADWPENERSLILKPAYHTAIVKDDSVQGTVGIEQSGVLQRSAVPQLHNFGLYKSNLVPTNSQNLKGMAVHPDAILVAGRVLVPDDKRNTITFEKMVDPLGSGIALGFREWFDATNDRTIRILEASYGYRTGNTAGLKRLVSA